MPESKESSSPVTFRKVVLPEPDGPMTADELARLDVQAEAAQGVGLHVLGTVDLADVLHSDHLVFSYSYR